MILVDAHLDLAYNAIAYGRNLRQPLATLREQEKGRCPGGIATVTLPELQRGGVTLVFGTLFVEPANSAMGHTLSNAVYHNSAQAHQAAQTQLDFYHQLVDEEEAFRLVTDLARLDEVVQSADGERPLLGIVPLMEGADPIRQPEEVELWVERGIRIIGPAWDDTQYAAGAWRNGRHGFTKAGFQLMERMAEFNLILDLTHLNEKATLEALDQYPGAIIASHSNARTLVPGERQLSNTQIRLLGERDGMIGIVLYNPFLKAHHKRGEHKEYVTLDHVTAHIDHICQLLGTARHVGIGSDLDGGLGAADIPTELDSVADLGKIATHLQQRGYDSDDIAGIMGQNWVRLLRQTWGKT
jgi:membrane dipeptidase